MDFAKRINQLKRLKWACRSVVGAATLVSIWANSLIADPGFTPLAISVLPPLIIMCGFELVSRIPIPANRPWLRRFARPTATAAITGIGAYLSYFHQKEAFFRFSHNMDNARWLPISIDGLMVIAAISLIEVNLIMDELVTRQAGLEVRIAAPRREPIQATNVRTALSGKERVALALKNKPDMTIKELARMAGVSEGYAGTLAGPLRRLAIEDAVEVTN